MRRLYIFLIKSCFWSHAKLLSDLWPAVHPRTWHRYRDTCLVGMPCHPTWVQCLKMAPRDNFIDPMTMLLNSFPLIRSEFTIVSLLNNILKYIATTFLSSFFQDHLHIRSQLSFSSGKKRIAFLISCFLIYSDLPQAFQCYPKEAALLLVIVLLISQKLALGCSAWRGTKEKLPLVRPKLRHVMKREIFVCLCECFPLLKVYFEKDLKSWSCVSSRAPTSFLSLLRMPLPLFQPIPVSVPILHISAQQCSAGHCAVIRSQKVAEYRSFAHSCIILFNKLIRITAVGQTPGKYRGLCIHSRHSRGWTQLSFSHFFTFLTSMGFFKGIYQFHLDFKFIPYDR